MSRPRRTRWAWPLVLLAVLTASCTAVAVPAPTAAPASGRPSGTSTLEPTASVGATQPPPADTPQPVPGSAGHVAAGLALVRLTDGGSRSQVFVVEADGGLRQITGFGPVSEVGASLPAWSPNGSMLAFGPPKVGAGPDRFLSIVGRDGAGESAIAPLGDEFGLPFGWSPDGGSLLFFDVDAVDGASIWLADVATGEVRRLVDGHVPRWLPDGRRISFVRGVTGRDPADPNALTQVVHLLTVADGSLQELAAATDAVWSPDGSAVLLQTESGDLVLAGSDGSSAHPLVRGWSPTWSPDGSRVVIGHDHDSDGTPLLAVVDLNGRILWSAVPGANPTWSPDATRIAVEVAYPEATVRVLDATTGEELWRAAGSQPAWGSWAGDR